MKTIIVEYGQTVLDLALMYWGSHEKVGDLLSANPLIVLDENIKEGTELKVPLTPPVGTDEQRRYFARKKANSGNI